MSTRCTVTVRETQGGREAYSLYRHCDGYPDTKHGVVNTLALALPLAWQAPRFEADDFAAAIVSAWKDGAGYIRLTSGRDAHGDTEFHYEVFPVDGCAKLQVYIRTRSDDWRKSGRVRDIG